MSFDQATYDRIREGCRRSAARVVPDVYEVVRPATVADVGGGEGWWAREFARLGAECLVLDESVAAPRDEVVSPGSVRFEPVDLTRPPTVDEPVDLVVCLEVAEHLPPDAAPGLVEFLCRLAPVVLFSAAIPGQGGHGHVNEQWPGYWADLFAARSFRAIDPRRRFWTNVEIEPWYRQNLIIYTSEKHLAPSDCEFGRTLPLVHPDIYEWRLREIAELLEATGRDLP